MYLLWYILFLFFFFFMMLIFMFALFVFFSYFLIFFGLLRLLANSYSFCLLLALYLHIFSLYSSVHVSHSPIIFYFFFRFLKTHAMHALIIHVYAICFIITDLYGRQTQYWIESRLVLHIIWNNYMSSLMHSFTMTISVIHCMTRYSRN